MKTEIRKILADKTETLEDGRVVIVPDFSQLDDLVDDLHTLFSLHFVSQQRELLLAWEEQKYFDFDWAKKKEMVTAKIDKYLDNNCG
jgi:hypothetical protein